MGPEEHEYEDGEDGDSLAGGDEGLTGECGGEDVDEEECEGQTLDDASSSSDGASRTGPATCTIPLAELAPIVRPDRLIPGLFTVDVPGLRLQGRCHRSCCNPGSEKEWLVKHKPLPYLLPPLMPAMEPTVVFGVCEEASEEANLQPCVRPKLYVRFGGVHNNGVKAAMKTAGFRVMANKSSNNYNALWSGALKVDEFKKLNRYQRVNHFPGTWQLGRKDRLCTNIGRMRRRFPDVFNIQPRSFVLPNDADEWRLECERYPDGMYILKPPASSRGRGIRMMRRPSDIKPEKDLLIQRYVRNPHLIDGYKYDMRMYVAVTCVDPLRVYVYREGLVRLATMKYSDNEKDLKKRCMHLTNYSVNVKKEDFTMGEGAEDDDVGFKWSLSALRRHFDKEGLDYGAMWAKCKDVIVKTLMCVESKINTQIKMHVPDRRICYEVFGFDLMLDTNLQPWLIEVNTGPSLSAPSALDMHIKHRMVANLFNLVGFVPYDRARFEAEEGARRQARLTGVPTAVGKGKGEGASDGAGNKKIAKAGAAVTAAAALTQGANARGGRLGSGRGGASNGLASAPSGSRSSGSAPSGFPQKRDIKALEGWSFDNIPLADLPEVVQEAEAELARAGEFERCFPTASPADNDFYLSYFESARFDNVLLCKWEAFKHQLRRERSCPDVTSTGASVAGPDNLSREGARTGSAPWKSLRKPAARGSPTPFAGGRRPVTGGASSVRPVDIIGNSLASHLSRMATVGGALGACVHTRGGVDGSAGATKTKKAGGGSGAKGSTSRPGSSRPAGTPEDRLQPQPPSLGVGTLLARARMGGARPGSTGGRSGKKPPAFR